MQGKAAGTFDSIRVRMMQAGMAHYAPCGISSSGMSTRKSSCVPSIPRSSPSLAPSAIIGGPELSFSWKKKVETAPATRGSGEGRGGLGVHYMFFL